jgi:hypothetical protein
MEKRCDEVVVITKLSLLFIEEKMSHFAITHLCFMIISNKSLYKLFGG